MRRPPETLLYHCASYVQLEVHWAGAVKTVVNGNAVVGNVVISVEDMTAYSSSVYMTAEGERVKNNVDDVKHYCSGRA